MGFFSETNPGWRGPRGAPRRSGFGELERPVRGFGMGVCLPGTRPEGSSGGNEGGAGHAPPRQFGNNLADVLTSRYGLPMLKTYRHVEKNFFKIKKLELDLKFLDYCKLKIALLANSTYVQQNQETYSSDFTEQVTNSLQNLKSDEHIVITKPDKGRGIVLLSRTDYINKLSSILSDSSKFQLLNVNLATHLLKLEAKLNRIVRPLKTILDETIYHSIFSAGSRAGFMYGLPKVHKPGLPLRPIISSIGTFSYNLAKFLVQIIQPLTYNEYTISNSSNFINEISHLRFDDTITMASFDVESLFTNVPLAETTQIITNNTTAEFLSQFGLEKKQLLSLLIVVTKDSVFTFDNRLYTQIDGVAMGSPIGPNT
ncbi:uncharacterized protein LOC119569744 [Penaeus monodon]|uniref:uncharacterized protein LOC119569744 n=1 Tax=Penaeus monodon TaxID=6687 RepID=UPI0018A7D4B5|nr:uncharacterized protein LOC119569744 [Penaeus monodon]